MEKKLNAGSGFGGLKNISILFGVCLSLRIVMAVALGEKPGGYIGADGRMVGTIIGGGFSFFFVALIVFIVVKYARRRNNDPRAGLLSGICAAAIFALLAYIGAAN